MNPSFRKNTQPFTLMGGIEEISEKIRQGRLEFLKDLKARNGLFPKQTRYANLKPRTAAIILLMLLTTMTYGLISYKPISYNENKGGEDLRCCRRIVERTHAGESYYEAVRSELQTRGYSTSSVFNWRLPTLGWLMGHLPSSVAVQAVAIILAFSALLVWMSALQKEASFPLLLCGSSLLLGPVIYSLVPGVFWAHEFWAGTCITLSLVCYARGWRLLSVASGLFSLFVRELALPFTCLMTIASYMQGHRREALFWLLGMIAFAIGLSYHSVMVADFITTGNPIQEEGWVAFGGWSFILRTAQMHPFLFMAPPWLTAVLLPLALLGLAGWGGPVGLRFGLTVGMYILSFAFVGKPFNQYWGVMYTNFFLLGLMTMPYSVHDLFQSACRIRR